MPFARLSDRVTRKTLKLFRKPRRSSLRYLRFLLLALVLANQKKLLTEGSEGSEESSVSTILQREFVITGVSSRSGQNHAGNGILQNQLVKLISNPIGISSNFM